MAVCQIALHRVGLLLEIQFTIGLHAVPTLGKAPQPLDAVPEREPQEQHLALLQGVDVFVVLINLAHPSLVAPAEDDAEEVRGKETAEGEIFVIDNFHLFSFRLIRCSGACRPGMP